MFLPRGGSDMPSCKAVNSSSKNPRRPSADALSHPLRRPTTYLFNACPSASEVRTLHTAHCERGACNQGQNCYTSKLTSGHSRIADRQLKLRQRPRPTFQSSRVVNRGAVVGHLFRQPCREVAKKSKLIDRQAVALQSGKARAAGSASKGPFTLKRCKTDEALVLGLSKAQPVKQA